MVMWTVCGVFVVCQLHCTLRGPSVVKFKRKISRWNGKKIHDQIQRYPWSTIPKPLDTSTIFINVSVSAALRLKDRLIHQFVNVSGLFPVPAHRVSIVERSDNVRRRALLP